MGKNIVIIGGSGAIGRALTNELSNTYKNSTLIVFSRKKPKNILANASYHKIDYHDEASIAKAASVASEYGLIDIVIIAIGILHDDGIFPEKSLKELSVNKFQYLFEINTIAPALIIKHFYAKLHKDHHTILAALSARVGSISDNKTGGWYAYRSSKAALNMIIKSAAIEIARSNSKAIVVGLHPGTVNSKLSEPFQQGVPCDQVFSPEFSANKLMQVLQNLAPENSGQCFAWNGEEIKP